MTAAKKTSGNTSRATGKPFTKGDPRRSPGGGKKGASGRTPDAVKLACLHAFADRIPLLAALADGALEQSDQLRAIDTLAKYAGVAALALSIDRPVTIAILGLDE